MNKKGISIYSVLVGIIAALVVFFMLSFVSPEKAYAMGNRLEVESDCQLKIFAHYQGNSVDVAPSVSCGYLAEELSENNNNDLMQDIATDAAWCWTMYDQGQRGNLFGGTIRGRGDNRCAICVQFGISGRGIKVEGPQLFGYMDVSPYKMTVEKQDTGKNYMSFNEYIQNGKGYLLIHDAAVFEPGDQYAVVFVEPHSWVQTVGVGSNPKNTKIQDDGKSLIYIDKIDNIRADSELNCKWVN